jgi:hypothetical protein
MLVAEIHGHVLEAAEDDEDYLTSAVFGHLRYIRPSVFWEDFFAEAKGSAVTGSLRDRLAAQGVRVSEYTSVQIAFWPSFPGLGEPDLLLCFTGAGLRPLVVLTEVKLWAGKSNSEERDQLVDYVTILGDLRHLKTNEALPDRPLTALLYLTPRESVQEVRESLIRLNSQPENFLGIFRVQWQDLLLAVSWAAPVAGGMERTILNDVERFLQRRRLEYFRGFREEPRLASLHAEELGFYTPTLFSQVPFEPFAIRRGGWIP